MLDSSGRAKSEKNLFKSDEGWIFFFPKPRRNNVKDDIFRVLVETRKMEAYHIKMRVNSVIYIQNLLL